MSFFNNNVDEVNLFHFNEIDTNMFHIVYNIEDEYQVGTKRVGNKMNLPFRQFVNCFFFLENEYFLLEETIDQYQEDIIKHIESKASVSINQTKLENTDFLKISNSLNGHVKKVEYIDENNDDYFLESIRGEEFEAIINRFILDRLTLLVENRFVSIYRKGKVSVDNSNEDYLIKFTRQIVDAIYNNH